MRLFKVFEVVTSLDGCNIVRGIYRESDKDQAFAHAERLRALRWETHVRASCADRDRFDAVAEWNDTDPKPRPPRHRSPLAF